jgi:ubiquinone/menaquinone biosynthesis C-methylase UbiE
MASTKDFSKFFNDKNVIKKYDQNTPTAKISEETLEIYAAKGGTLAGKTILDNACGTGVVTRAILKRTSDVTIEATDFSEAMIEAVEPLAASAAPAKVRAQVMDAQVPQTPRAMR